MANNSCRFQGSAAAMANMTAGRSTGGSGGSGSSGWIRFLSEARQLVSVSDRLGDDWQLRTFEASKNSDRVLSAAGSQDRVRVKWRVCGQVPGGDASCRRLLLVLSHCFALVVSVVVVLVVAASRRDSHNRTSGGRAFFWCSLFARSQEKGKERRESLSLPNSVLTGSLEAAASLFQSSFLYLSPR